MKLKTVRHAQNTAGWHAVTRLWWKLARAACALLAWSADTHYNRIPVWGLNETFELLLSYCVWLLLRHGTDEWTATHVYWGTPSGWPPERFNYWLMHNCQIYIGEITTLYAYIPLWWFSSGPAMKVISIRSLLIRHVRLLIFIIFVDDDVLIIINIIIVLFLDAWILRPQGHKRQSWHVTKVNWSEPRLLIVGDDAYWFQAGFSTAVYNKTASKNRREGQQHQMIAVVVLSHLLQVLRPFFILDESLQWSAVCQQRTSLEVGHRLLAKFFAVRHLPQPVQLIHNRIQHTVLILRQAACLKPIPCDEGVHGSFFRTFLGIQ